MWKRGTGGGAHYGPSGAHGRPAGRGRYSPDSGGTCGRSGAHGRPGGHIGPCAYGQARPDVRANGPSA
jgi:hypothetical protein